MPGSQDLVLYEAVRQYARKDYSAAAAMCARILSSAPDHVDALYLSGLCHGRTGSPDIGMRLIKQALALKPELAYYDISREWLIQRSVTNQVTLWEKLFLNYQLFRTVDAFLISYPKSGRTWLRALLGKYVMGESGQGDPLEILFLTRDHPEFSTLLVSHDDNPHWKPWEKICVTKQAYAGKKVIFLARDPRDILISYYFQYTLRNDRKYANDEAFDGSLSDFIRHDIGGLRSLVGFYNIWAANRHVPADFLLITYEEMKADVWKVLRQAVSFLGWPERDRAFIDTVIAFGSFDNMRRLEETNALENPRLKPPEDGNPEGFKIRKGKVGGYVDYLTEGDTRYIDDYLRDHLDDYFAFYK